jgi:hypothetical protein
MRLNHKRERDTPKEVVGSDRGRRHILLIAIIGPVAVLTAPVMCEAALECVGDAEFVLRCLANVQHIHNSSPAGMATVDRLRDSSNLHLIVETEGSPQNLAVNGDAALSLSSGGTGLGSPTITSWNPNDFSAVDGAPGSPSGNVGA